MNVHLHPSAFRVLRLAFHYSTSIESAAFTYPNFRMGESYKMYLWPVDLLLSFASRV